MNMEKSSNEFYKDLEIFKNKNLKDLKDFDDL